MERRWPTHEKEMWAVIHCLKTWGHYIGSKDVVVWTNNVTLKYFATQPKLSSKQVRWQDTLALFNVDIWHKPGKENIVPDALSRKHQFRVVYVGETKLQKEVRLESRQDAFTKEVRQNIQMEPSPISICEMDYCGTNKTNSKCRKERWGTSSWKNVMMDRLRAMVVQNAPQHS